jgi:hypothetical protein
LTGIARIWANASRSWRSAWAGISHPPISVLVLAFASGTNIELVLSNTTRSGHLCSVWIRMLIPWFNGTSDAGAGAIGEEKNQFAANSATRRKPPTHPKY